LTIASSNRKSGKMHLNQLTRMMTLAIFTWGLTNFAIADGLPLVDGRYPIGKVSVFTLSDSQRTFIECVRERNTDNAKTPYVFRLTSVQAARLKRESGLSPKRFEVYETFRGFNDAGPHWNLALRFNETQIEIPHKLLLSNRKAEDAEFKVQGWLPNLNIEVDCKVPH